MIDSGDIVSLVYGTLIGMSLMLAGYGVREFWTTDPYVAEVRAKIKRLRAR